MWGCFCVRKKRALRPSVFPTYVGVFPALEDETLKQTGLPHVCGGVSVITYPQAHHMQSSPRMWGCFLDGFCFCRGFDRLPHVGGGVSCDGVAEGTQAVSSPRMWGCFQDDEGLWYFDIVFPTYVGVFLRHSMPQQLATGLPHVCGGFSTTSAKMTSRHGSSPRMWGCFYKKMQVGICLIVFPTYVGVFL